MFDFICYPENVTVACLKLINGGECSFYYRKVYFRKKITWIYQYLSGDAILFHFSDIILSQYVLNIVGQYMYYTVLCADFQ